MSSSPDQQPSAIDSLQFEKAEITGRQCLFCKRPTGPEYWQIGGADACAACANTFSTGQQRPRVAQVLCGLLFGIGAAIVCALGYGLITYLIEMEFGLIAILVGWLVGTAIRIGSRGMGGRRCQVAGLALTFFAITGGYVPIVFKQLTIERDKLEAQVKQANLDRQAGKKVDANIPAALPERSALARVVYSAILAVMLPFLQLTDGFSGILGFIIIGIGLHQAWRVTARDDRLLVGPLQEEQTSA